MAIFCLKKIGKPLRVGEILRQKRKELKLSIDNIGTSTHIPKKYIIALEKNRYKVLPMAKAHCLAYVRKYSECLKINCDEVVKQFIKESDLDNYKTVHPHCKLKIRPINPIVIWTRRLSLFAVLFLFVGYLFWQINGILKPPKLIVFSPGEGYISTNIKTLIQGESEKEVTLKINGKETSINDKGKFETIINLSKGVNTITISATKKHGKTTTITRHVIKKETLAQKQEILSLNN